jgi:protein involved in polysaccharide export with SLBB domain
MVINEFVKTCKHQLLLVFFCSFLSLVVLGCAHSRGLTLQAADIAEMNSRITDDAHVLGSGDRIEVKFYYNDKLNEEITIRHDGRISLQLIGEIMAAGRTPVQLENLIEDKYAEVLMSSSQSYLLGVGERIAVRFYYNDKLNEEVIIRPDGRISLQLIGDVTAAGLKPAQLEALLVEKYTTFIDSPKVAVIVKDVKMPEATVIVKETASQKIYIGGEVANPKLIPIQGTLRLLDAVILAGGERDSAEISNAVLIRYDGSEEPVVYSVNLKEILSGSMPDINLRSYDIVYLPKKDIAKAELFLKQYIYNLLPSHVLFSFPYNLNPENEVRIIE